jgi:hypothetical protein
MELEKRRETAKKEIKMLHYKLEKQKSLSTSISGSTNILSSSSSVTTG